MGTEHDRHVVLNGRQLAGLVGDLHTGRHARGNLGAPRLAEQQLHHAFAGVFRHQRPGVHLREERAAVARRGPVLHRVARGHAGQCAQLLAGGEAVSLRGRGDGGDGGFAVAVADARQQPVRSFVRADGDHLLQQGVHVRVIGDGVMLDAVEHGQHDVELDQ